MVTAGGPFHARLADLDRVLAARIMPNTALTGATYDIDGVQSFVPV